jgi:hypothetical protein
MQGVAEAECRRAADAAEAAYAAAFRDDIEPDEGAFEVEHRRALDAAAAAYEVGRTLLAHVTSAD